MVYHPGDKNQVGDCLLCIAIQDNDSDCCDEATIATMFWTSAIAVIDLHILALHASNDEDMSILRQYIIKGWPVQFDQQR